METTIPFAGFYNSIHSEELDNALEQTFSDSNGNPINSLLEKAYDKVDWSTARNKYAESYVAGLIAEIEFKSLKFKLITSPKYYNFETDRIFCEIDASEVKEIFDKTDKAKLNAEIKANFTSRSGFISYYSNTLESWPSDLTAWDHNQVGTLLAVYIDQVLDKPLTSYKEFELACGDTSETSYEIINESLTDCERLFKIRSYIRDRQERKYRRE